MSPSAIRVTNDSAELVPLTAACQAVTISSTAGTLETLGSFTFDANCKRVVVVIKSNPVNFDPSGTAPTSSVGLPVLAGQIVEMSIAEAKLAKWIRSGGSDATVNVSQYRY